MDIVLSPLMKAGIQEKTLERHRLTLAHFPPGHAVRTGSHFPYLATDLRSPDSKAPKTLIHTYKKDHSTSVGCSHAFMLSLDVYFSHLPISKITLSFLSVLSDLA